MSDHYIATNVASEYKVLRQRAGEGLYHFHAKVQTGSDALRLAEVLNAAEEAAQ